MQDLTTAECAEIANGESARLEDKRDGKLYWVSKIGNSCVMTQNLALDITAEGLTSELTDINPSDNAGYATVAAADGTTIYKWDATAKYPPQATAKAAFASSTATATNSWNFGTYVRITPSTSASCTSPMSCPTGFQLINEASNPIMEISDAVGARAYDSSTGAYDPHYLIGNYYQYMTATAGSLVMTAGTTPASSICPKGWRLPYTTASSGYGNDELTGMLRKYTDVINTSHRYGKPMHITASGYLNINGAFVYPGGVAYLWTGNVVSATAAGYLSNNLSNSTADLGFQNSSLTFARALPVRCVLREE